MDMAAPGWRWLYRADIAAARRLRPRRNGCCGKRIPTGATRLDRADRPIDYPLRTGPYADQIGSPRECDSTPHPARPESAGGPLGRAGTQTRILLSGRATAEGAGRLPSGDCAGSRRQRGARLRFAACGKGELLQPTNRPLRQFRPSTHFRDPHHVPVVSKDRSWRLLTKAW